MTSRRTSQKVGGRNGSGSGMGTGRGQKGQSEMGPQMKMTLAPVGYLPVQAQIVYGPGGQHSPPATWMLIKPGSLGLQWIESIFLGLWLVSSVRRNAFQNVRKSVHEIVGMMGNVVSKLLRRLVIRKSVKILHTTFVSLRYFD